MLELNLTSPLEISSGYVNMSYIGKINGQISATLRSLQNFILLMPKTPLIILINTLQLLSHRLYNVIFLS